MARLKACRKAASLAVLSILVLTQTSPAQARKIKRQSSENNLISSGTCYYGPGQQADSAYIPCGNTAFGNFHCCEAQSNCLDNNACYDGDQGTTYVAGCTDPTYQDSSCPSKGIYSNQQWSGLVYCNGTSDEWTLCDDSSVNSNQVVYVGGCYCPNDESSRNVAFGGPPTLGNQVMLPAATGESMSVFPGFTLGTVLTSTPSPTTTTTTTTTTPTPQPTITSSVKSTTSKTTSKPPSAIISTTSSSIPSTSSSSASSSINSSGATTTSSQSSSSTSGSSAAAATTSGAAVVVPATSGLSTGAKAGIGAAAGILLLGLLAFLAVCLRRRKRRSMHSAAPTTEIQPVTQYQQQYQTEPTANPHRYSPAWSAATQSELVGDTSTSSPSIPQSNWSRPLSEAEGSYPTYQSMESHPTYQSMASYPTYQSMASYPTSELGPGGAYQRSQPYQAATASSTSQGSYRPGRRMEGGERGVYEMPAQLPGSSMM